MKVKNGIERTRSVARRCLAARTAATSPVLAAATIPAMADNRSGTVSNEDPTAIRSFGTLPDIAGGRRGISWTCSTRKAWSTPTRWRIARRRYLDTPLSLERSSQGLMAVLADAVLAFIMQNMANYLISVVDDDEAFRKATTNLLKASGFAVERFSSAEEFLDSPRVNETGCLILDLRMRGMSGLELQSHLARANRRIPIIFITARGCAEAREEAMRAGAVDFLPKPFSEEALLRAIHKALTRKTKIS